MTRRDITRLFVKFFGLFILLIAVAPLPIQISAFIGTLAALNQNSVVLGASKSGYTWQTVAIIVTSLFVPLVIKAAVGLCFIRWSGWIADKTSFAPEDEIVEAADLRNYRDRFVCGAWIVFHCGRVR